MNESQSFFMLVEKVCTKYDIDSMYQEGFTPRGFANQVHEASEGDIRKKDILNWIARYGVKKVFEKVIFVFARGTPYGSHLNKALSTNWAWSPLQMLEPKYIEPMRLGDTLMTIGELYGKRNTSQA